LYGLSDRLANLLPDSYGAIFRVSSVDPDGSGMDYPTGRHLGAYIYNAQICCHNCTIIFAAWRPLGEVNDGPSFCKSELVPVNEAARLVLGQAAREKLVMNLMES